ncbi:MAG: hypothetical protein AMXMBFR57_08710 [Acidimicrobiia bacterium]
MQTRLTLTSSLALAVAAMSLMGTQVAARQSPVSSPCDRAPVSEGRDRAIQRTAGDLQVCLLAEAVDAGTADAPPSRWVANAARIVIETRQGNTVQRLERAGGRESWSVNGTPRPVDEAVHTWRDRALEALDAPLEIARLQLRMAAERSAMNRLRMSPSRVYVPVDPTKLEVDIAIERRERVRIQSELSDHQFAITRMERDIRLHEAAMTRLTDAVVALR